MQIVEHYAAEHLDSSMSPAVSDSDAQDICNVEELWDYFSSVVAPQIIKYQVRESTSSPTLGKLLDVVCSRVSKVEVNWTNDSS